MTKAVTTRSTRTTAILPFQATVAVGTYDGVLAGWEIGGGANFRIAFASPTHGGSIRSLAMAAAAATATDRKKTMAPGSLISCGYDEMIHTHDCSKRLTSSGQVRTPADFGTPVCSSFAPPPQHPRPSSALQMARGCAPDSRNCSTHCLVGFSAGKLVIYKKRDWSVQHVLAGHDGGVSALAVHPTGKMALSGGTSDGKLKLWDLQKGRLAYVTKIYAAKALQAAKGRTHYDPIVSLVWSRDGAIYALAYGSHVTVRDVGTGKELLDVELPARVNQICLMQKDEQGAMYVAAACNDGSIPVLAVNMLENSHLTDVRAIMAIEAVEGPVAREERFKCIQSLQDYYVVTANSAGVVSLMNLEGAVKMILQEEEESQETIDANANAENILVNSESDEESEDDDNDDDEESGEEELAVDIVDSVRLGTGARITCLSAWCSPIAPAANDTSDDDTDNLHDEHENTEDALPLPAGTKRNSDGPYEEPYKRIRDGRPSNEVVMGQEALETARKLVSKAKKLQLRKEKKRAQPSKSPSKKAR
jgi:protein MAK11